MREKVASQVVKPQFYRIVCRWTFISREKVASQVVKSQFYRIVCRWTFISCEKVASQAARKTKNEDGKRQKRRFTYRFWALCRGPRSTVPATKNESNSTTVSQNAILDRVIKIHQILRLPRKMRSESASHFDPRQRFSNLPKVAGLPRFCT